jgi:hypothetical protein
MEQNKREYAKIKAGKRRENEK